MDTQISGDNVNEYKTIEQIHLEGQVNKTDDTGIHNEVLSETNESRTTNLDRTNLDTITSEINELNDKSDETQIVTHDNDQICGDQLIPSGSELSEDEEEKIDVEYTDIPDPVTSYNSRITLRRGPAEGVQNSTYEGPITRSRTNAENQWHIVPKDQLIGTICH